MKLIWMAPYLLDPGYLKSQLRSCLASPIPTKMNWGSGSQPGSGIPNKAFTINNYYETWVAKGSWTLHPKQTSHPKIHRMDNGDKNTTWIQKHEITTVQWDCLAYCLCKQSSEVPVFSMKLVSKQKAPHELARQKYLKISKRGVVVAKV